ncbi:MULTISPECIES: hypothetical protein [unclassified Nonomuraea]|uniref:hypothetical protein n=1 Tax=unclassified Nonomuraea TaxID=2593643 RepID=UPI0033EF26E7
MTVDTTAAQAAHDEAKGKSRAFTWTHTDDDGQDHVLELAIPRKFKRFKFARRAGAGDFVGALEVVFGLRALEPMEEWEMDAEEWERFMTALGEAIGGTGNS